MILKNLAGSIIGVAATLLVSIPCMGQFTPNTVFYPISSVAALPASCVGAIGWVVSNTAGADAGKVYTCKSGVPTLYGGGGGSTAPVTFVNTSVATPAAPTVTVISTGTDHCGYAVSAFNGIGFTPLSPYTSVTNCNAASLNNHVTVPSGVSGVLFYLLYLAAETHGVSGYVAGVLPGATYTDTTYVGQDPAIPTPVVNTTKGIIIGGGIAADTGQFGNYETPIPPQYANRMETVPGFVLMSTVNGNQSNGFIPIAGNNLETTQSGTKYPTYGAAFAAISTEAVGDSNYLLDGLSATADFDGAGIVGNVSAVQSTTTINGTGNVQANAGNYNSLFLKGSPNFAGGGLPIASYNVLIDISSGTGAAYSAAVEADNFAGDTISPDSYGVVVNNVQGGTAVNEGFTVTSGIVVGTGALGLHIADSSLDNQLDCCLTIVPQALASLTALTVPAGTQMSCQNCVVNAVTANVVTDSTCKSSGTRTVPAYFDGSVWTCAYLPHP